MGTVKPGEEEPRRTFVGIATHSEEGEAPTLNEALESAAEKAIHAGLIAPNSNQTVWFDITFIEVELGNQHPRTFKVGVTQQLPPPGT